VAAIGGKKSVYSAIPSSRTVHFPNGVTFTPTTAASASISDQSGGIFKNTAVIPGVVSFNNSQAFSIFTSSDLSVSGQTIGLSDTLHIDVSRVAASMAAGT
jgi:hypothetical protein